MRRGQVPIHIQRWSPVDYHSDEHVKLLKRRRNYRVLTFYRHFIDASYQAGGDLEDDIDLLSAAVDMPVGDVSIALRYCLGRLIFKDGNRLYQPRVRREVFRELEYRSGQSEIGRLGGRPSYKGSGKGTLSDPESPPSPAPAPTPITPPLPPSREGGAPDRPTSTRVTRTTQVDQLVRVWGRLLNGHGSPPAGAREQLDRSLRRLAFWEVAASVSEMARSTLLERGVPINGQWPPEGWLSEEGPVEAGVAPAPEFDESLFLEIRANPVGLVDAFVVWASDRDRSPTARSIREWEVERFGRELTTSMRHPLLLALGKVAGKVG